MIDGEALVGDANALDRVAIRLTRKANVATIDAVEAWMFDELAKALGDLCRAEQWQSAVEFATRQVGESAATWEVHWNWGWALFKLDRWREAETHLVLATQLEPAEPLTFWALGVVQRELREYEQAEASFRDALQRRDSYLARLNLATMLLELGRVGSAEAVHKEGLALRPEHRERLEAYADFLDDTGRETEASMLRERAMSLPTREQRKRGSAAQY